MRFYAELAGKHIVIDTDLLSEVESISKEEINRRVDMPSLKSDSLIDQLVIIGQGTFEERHISKITCIRSSQTIGRLFVVRHSVPDADSRTTKSIEDNQWILFLGEEKTTGNYVPSYLYNKDALFAEVL